MLPWSALRTQFLANRIREGAKTQRKRCRASSSEGLRISVATTSTLAITRADARSIPLALAPQAFAARKVPSTRDALPRLAVASTRPTLIMSTCPMRGRTENGWVDRQRLPCTLQKSGDSTVRASSKYEIARRLNIGRTSVRRILARPISGRNWGPAPLRTLTSTSQ
jgi:hypothetical protein